MSTIDPAEADGEIAVLMDRLMRRISAGLNVRAPEFDVHGVGPQGGMLLLTLAEIEPAPMHRLVRAMARDKSQMTRSVRMLERAGLIERSGAPDDARVSVLTLTEEGRTTVAALQRAVAVVLSDLLAPLSREERATLKDVLARL